MAAYTELHDAAGNDEFQNRVRVAVWAVGDLILDDPLQDFGGSGVLDPVADAAKVSLRQSFAVEALHPTDATVERAVHYIIANRKGQPVSNIIDSANFSDQNVLNQVKNAVDVFAAAHAG